MPAQPQPDFEQQAAREVDGRPSVHLAPAAAIAGSAIPADYHRPRRSAFLRRAYIWFILPALLAYGVIFLYPTARAFILSFFDWPGYGPIGAFVGIGLKMSGGLREGRYVPFGPFLAGGGLAVLLIGTARVAAWLGLQPV